MSAALPFFALLEAGLGAASSCVVVAERVRLDFPLLSLCAGATGCGADVPADASAGCVLTAALIRALERAGAGAASSAVAFFLGGIVMARKVWYANLVVAVVFGDRL